ncbi:DUF6119 family protein [Bdellovibrio bacteriovorus]|uniref:DUF6119 family protein n=1 Tax=Bdellovibrio bacteriovorus TaxID=959 RepID=UPI003AA9E152
MIRLTIHMLKKMDRLEDAVESEYKGKIQKVAIKDCDEAILVFKDPRDSKPDWFDYLKPIKANLPETLSSPSALLIIKTNESIFGVTMGFGRFILNLNKVISDFGLKVCLNSIPSNKIKTLDKTNLEQIGFHTRQQAAIPMDFNTFNIEIERDLLKSVEGHLENGIAPYLKGSSSLTISTDKEISELASLCISLKKAYHKDTYKKEFGWIDNIKLLKDDQQIGKLNLLLEQSLLEEQYEKIFLGAPEIVNDEIVGHYQFIGLRDTSKYSIFPSIEQYMVQRTTAQTKKTSLIEATQSDRLEAMDRDKKNPSKVYKWTIYRCLHAEIEDDNKTYKLLDGDWYEVSEDFIKDIDNTINQIPISNIAFPNMGLTEKEATYNITVANQLSAACLDRDLIHPPGRTPFEFCDIFTKDSHLIHIKKYTGASAMSHLLYQAYVSGQLYGQNPDIRSEVEKKSSIQQRGIAHLANPKDFSTNNYEIIIAVATVKNKPIKKVLSFFSKVSLAHKYKVLKGLGYRVTIAKIQIA